ncbi:amidohydrolase family protein [Algoriphagus sp. H41]|uniref:Amidohydrolase family protein n=1 Tax=Algoriphagus oliviformis TaxID=2811231 RepID=A0ABS3C180_9BACT|nr:amidohydrolase family protein [Algoriphagus oliviformis]MBN7810875.1 amidohydrolase family protein [Algoriphagus oliviformis]
MEDRIVLSGKSFLDGSPLKLRIGGGLISRVEKIAEPLPDDQFLGPGLMDIQVNGYGGWDYNAVYDEVLSLGQISRKLLQVGVTSHFPTIITNSPEQISRLIRQIVTLCREDKVARDCIAGIHIEGPFISPEDGPRGAHPREFVQAPDWDLFERWMVESQGLVRMVTLSPEWDNSPSFIEKCVEKGILVSIGHTKASPAQVIAAVAAGARLSTHLGNGMHGQIARHPNYLWSQLAEDRLAASIIADGFHLPPEVIRVFKRAKGEQLLLVSDSTSLAGMPAGDYELHIGGQITLSPEGKLHLRSNPQMLAGSAMNLLQGIEFLLEKELATLSEAWKMASTRPHRLFDPMFDPIKVGAKADLILIQKGPNQSLKVLKTIKNGKEVFSS